MTVSVPALTTKSTLQVSSTAPSGVTAAGVTLAQHGSRARVVAAAEALRPACS